jgi:hypothetical protein
MNLPKIVLLILTNGRKKVTAQLKIIILPILCWAFLSDMSIKSKDHHNTIATLVVTIKEVMANLDKDTVAKACCCFRIRIKAVVEANRDFLKSNST